jgi:hypothetical protein
MISDKSFDQPISIAVLPFENMTADLPAGELMRLYFCLGLKEKGYTVMEISQVDSILQRLGITDGGQLGSITPEELQKMFKTEGLLYGTLIKATYSTLGVTTSKNVTANARVMRNGTEVFSDEETSKEGGLGNLVNPLKGLADQIVDKQFEKMFAKYRGHPLDTHIEAVAYKIQNKMPGKREEKSGWN